MSKDQSIPAFPMSSTVSNGQIFDCAQYGMSLRDYFAAKAMHAYLASNTQAPDRDIAKGAYDLADAMLKERKL